MFPKIVATLIEESKNKITDEYKTMLLQGLSTCFYYSVEQTMNYLESKGITGEVMQSLLKEAVNSDGDFLTRNIRAVICLLLEGVKLPKIIQKEIGYIYNFLAILCNKFIELSKEKKKEEKEDEDEEEKGILKFLGSSSEIQKPTLKDNKYYSSPLRQFNTLLYVKQGLEKLAKENPELYLLLEKQLTQEGKAKLQNALLTAAKN